MRGYVGGYIYVLCGQVSGCGIWLCMCESIGAYVGVINLIRPCLALRRGIIFASWLEKYVSHLD